MPVITYVCMLSLAMYPYFHIVSRDGMLCMLATTSEHAIYAFFREQQRQREQSSNVSIQQQHSSRERKNALIYTSSYIYPIYMQYAIIGRM